MSLSNIIKALYEVYKGKEDYVYHVTQEWPQENGNGPINLIFKNGLRGAISDKKKSMARVSKGVIYLHANYKSALFMAATRFFDFWEKIPRVIIIRIPISILDESNLAGGGGSPLDRTKQGLWDYAYYKIGDDVISPENLTIVWDSNSLPPDATLESEYTKAGLNVKKLIKKGHMIKDNYMATDNKKIYDNINESLIHVYKKLNEDLIEKEFKGFKPNDRVYLVSGQHEFKELVGTVQGYSYNYNTKEHDIAVLMDGDNQFHYFEPSSLRHVDT